MAFPLRVPPASSKAFDIVGFGQNSLDLVAVVAEHPAADSSVPVEELVRLPGGEVATAAVACARLGLGFIGSDLDEVYLNAAIERVQDAGKPRMAKAGLKSAKWLKANG